MPDADLKRKLVSELTQTDPTICEDEETQAPECRTVGIDAESHPQPDEELEQLLHEDAMTRLAFTTVPCVLVPNCTHPKYICLCKQFIYALQLA